VKLSHEDIPEIEVLADVAMATIFWLCIYGVHIGATWRIRLNHPCAAAMRPYVKLLSPLVVVVVVVVVVIKTKLTSVYLS